MDAFAESGVAGYAVAGLAICGVSIEISGAGALNMPTGRRKKREPGAAESIAKPAPEITAELVAPPALRSDRTETQFRQRENEKAVLLLMLH